MQHTSVWSCLLGLAKLLSRSRPETHPLQLPRTTPSTLSIGTTLNTNLPLNSTATGSSDAINSMNPCTMWELQGSPGRDLATSTITGLNPRVNFRRASFFSMGRVKDSCATSSEMKSSLGASRSSDEGWMMLLVIAVSYTHLTLPTTPYV
eukprot:TRINITY_DN22629_c0_g1_i2.p1 TRINITY_DN22629_c0_g1~~TRINITY_DN22629_c0_g1_i2.p1  ORF type:complete len:150 (+),score=14.78 TRINITY_DN22629_c0_g1_i2:22-471(+)